MNANAKKWVTALRSGKYQQGQSYLHRDNQFCCLGVACDLYINENPGKLKLKIDDVSGYMSYGGEPATLPNAVIKWLGLNDETGSYQNGDENLTSRNDAGLTFKQIADIIESEPPGLFEEKK